MNKLLWVDTETTGTDPVANDIIQVAGMIIIDNNVECEFNLLTQPIYYANVSEKALQVNGKTLEQIREYPEPGATFEELGNIFDDFIDRYDKTDKFIACGQNVRFDINMLSEFFKKNGNPYFFAYVSPAMIDIMQLAIMWEMKIGQKLFPAYNLESICSVLGVEIMGAHDAKADIVATRQAGEILWKNIFKMEWLAE